MVDSIFGKPQGKSQPQFSTAQYAGAPGVEACRFCQQSLGEQFYRVNNAKACRTCAEKLKGAMPTDSHTAYVRGLLFGVVGAIVGLALYAGLSILLHGFTIGYMSFGVGIIVAKAMMLGSQNTGGRRYQIAAILLTYAAVSMAAIPVALVQIANHPKKPRQTETRPAAPRTEQPADQAASPPEDQPDTTEQHAPVAPKPALSLVAVLGTLALLGLASPFLELTANAFSGLIGLVILYVGMQIAWRLTAGRKIDIYGPFNSPPQKVEAPA